MPTCKTMNTDKSNGFAAGQDLAGRPKDLWEKRINNEVRYQKAEPSH
jgi:hypothetical protein